MESSCFLYMLQPELQKILTEYARPTMTCRLSSCLGELCITCSWFGTNPTKLPKFSCSAYFTYIQYFRLVCPCEEVARAIKNKCVQDLTEYQKGRVLTIYNDQLVFAPGACTIYLDADEVERIVSMLNNHCEDNRSFKKMISDTSV
jgi:hypothetical protein